LKNNLLKDKLLKTKPKSINLSQEQLITTDYLSSTGNLLLKITPNVEKLDLIDWAINNKDYISQQLLKHGGILFRNFNVGSTEKFESFSKIISNELEEYTERSTPREQVEGKVYTSTEYPKEQHILMHNESSYASSWPRKIWFYCVEAADQGGETPIADSRKVYQMLDDHIIQKFTEKKVMYVRNFGTGLDLSWQTAFQTNDHLKVEEHCRKSGIEFEWLESDRLRTKVVRPAIAKHPETKELLWFNQAHLFNVNSLPQMVRDQLLSMVKLEDLPRNTFYGDGTPIEESTIQKINHVFNRASLSFPWQKGDIMMLDNMLVAHGRAPFSGSRKVVVAMGDLCSSYGL